MTRRAPSRLSARDQPPPPAPGALASRPGDHSAVDWLRDAARPLLSLLLVLHRALARGGFDPQALRRALDTALEALQLDERGRDLGVRALDVQRIRLALIAAADELTQRPGSRCDYSLAPPAGEPPLLQQKHLGRTTSAGSLFSDELAALISAARLTLADAAVLEVFAICLALGVRGRHEPGPELDALRSGATARLRTYLGPPDLPPFPPAALPPAREEPHHRARFLALLALAAASALVVTYRCALARDEALLAAELAALEPPPHQP